MMMWDWVGYIDPDFILSVVTCDQYGGWSDTRLLQPGVRQALRRAGRHARRAKRRKIIWQMQKILYRDKPYIQLAQLDLIWPLAKRGTASSRRT